MTTDLIIRVNVRTTYANHHTSQHENVEVLVGDTQCPLQVCLLSRSSVSTHCLSRRRDVAFSFPTRALDIMWQRLEPWISCGNARRVPRLHFLTVPNIIRVRMPIFETKTAKILKRSDNFKPFKAVVTLAHSDEPHMKNQRRFGATPVLRTRP